MVNQAELLEAMAARHAVRRYRDDPIPASIRAELDQAVALRNQASGLAMAIRYDEPDGFSGRMAHYGNFRGVHNYLALIGSTGSRFDTAAGYNGEQIVLLAQHLGLNSCWVGLTYNKRHTRADLAADQRLALVVALGFGETGGVASKSKPIERLGSVRAGGAMPDWFRRGLAAAALAPTALNQQRFHFELDGDTVRASAGHGSYVDIDLGIAQYHFEVGADSPDWRWG